ncbi:right-handed parallel beta-helix repeat-containing protein [Sphingobacterium sp. UT-1RO-CII-1]|uniref:right-handed parallel beta-helix repeat-containing protein n=1 Tax=Sphingobacterium sp. UT-1RO-CII-1 TaxID=2995225 RepID=UPI00227BBB6C|nr:right-handed parallel beta-helix repeat-containing protein [Sphingobacterium sp. UT-1RO-CII-1]MCY4780037.1 right-handed parallel beta-helix repeat-containing protein [Sphingobacterium sp. UT-1RO-CII-1]
MTYFFKIIVVVFCLFGYTGTVVAQVVEAKDYGVLPNTFKDMSAAVQRLMKVAKEQSASKIVFEPGRYDFWEKEAFQRELYITNSSSETEWPDKTKYIALLVEDMKGLTIEGNGALFVMHGKMTSFSTIRSQDIRIQNLSFTFERPTMSEMTVVELSEDHMLADVHPTSSYTLIKDKLYWYGEGWTPGDHLHTITIDTLTGISRYSDYRPIVQAKVSEIAPNKLRFDGAMKANYKVGEILSMRNTVRDQVGAFIYRSKNVHLQNLNMQYMHGIGITSQFSEDLHYENIKVVPTQGRSIAAFADGMQFSGCKGLIKVHNCHFKGLHDDPINIHGTYLQIVDVLAADEVVVEFKHHQSYGFDAFQVQDTVRVVTQESMKPLGEMQVVSAEALSLTKIRLRLDSSLPKGTKVGDVLENMTWTPAVDIRGNRFERTNARGVLVSTPRRVWIENNVFYRTGMHGILIAGDVNSWFESGAVNDVTIQNNSFVDCGYNLPGNSYAIAIQPENKELVKGHFVHRNIRVINNDFQLFAPFWIRAKSTSGLLVKDNKVEQTTTAFPLPHQEVEESRIYVEGSEQVQIWNNKLNNADKLLIELKETKKKEVKTDAGVFM